LIPPDDDGTWEVWAFEEPKRLARYVSDEAEDSFPVADQVNWRIQERLERLEAIQQIYEMLAGLPEDQRIFYALEEYHPDQDKQPIRSPRKIREARRGTCLDLTLLFCGLCLPLRLCPVVVVTRDHAFALFGLKRTVGSPLAVDERPFSQGPVMDAELLQRLVGDGRYLALECTGFAAVEALGASRLPLSFEAAAQEGTKNLERELRFALDIASARYLMGVPPLPERAGEPLWPTLRRRWSRWEEARRAEVRFREQLEANVFNGRLLQDFEKFLLGPVWHKQIEELIEQIARPLTSDAGVQKFQRRLRQVDLSASYPSVVGDLKTALSTPGPKALHDSAARLERKTGLSHPSIPPARAHELEVQELARLWKMRGALFGLQKEVREPRHHRCLLLLGEVGSGKTHLSVSFQPDIAGTVPPEGEDWIPSPDTEWRSLLLWLRRGDPGATLREKMEGLLRRITGYSWKSLEHFQDYLRRVETWLAARNPRISYGLPRMVVVLDDFDRWLRTRETTLDEVENLILETSRLHSLYWVLTLQHTAFPEVARHRDFWNAYTWLQEEGSTAGDSRARRQIGSWIDLDRLNQIQRLGIEIVEKVSDAEDPDPLQLGIPSDSPMERDLSNPQNAWTLLRCRHELDLDYLVNLNFIGYVERFWEVRQRRMDPEPLKPATLPRLVGAAAAVMAEGLGFRPLRTALASAIARREKDRSELQDPDKVEVGIQILEGAGLWQETETRDQVGPVLRLELRNQFFWSFRIAQHLADRLRSQDAWDLATLLPEETDPYLREGVIEFLLLLMSESANGAVSSEPEGDPPGGGPAGALWRKALQLPGPTRASAWIAATKASPDIQRLVTQASGAIQPSAEREIFGFLYFIGEADPEVLSPTDRMILLQPFFPNIAAAGQVDYFLHVLVKALEQVENRQDLLGMLRRLVGVEVLKETRTIAYSVADAALRVCQGAFEEVLDLLIDYARQESRRLERASDPPPPPPDERDEGKHYLREWVLFATLAVAADHRDRNGPADLFPILWDTSWYNPRRLKVISRVGFEMEAQANTVLGYQYRKSGRQDRLDYETLIAQFAHSESWYERKLSFFLIRHTVVTGGKRGVRVSPTFYQLLAALFLDPDIRVQQSVQHFYDTFRMNLENESDFAELERERRSIVKGRDLVVRVSQDRQGRSAKGRRSKRGRRRKEKRHRRQ
jgi:hypothetical protein